jgi:hypothetical protein
MQANQVAVGLLFGQGIFGSRRHRLSGSAALSALLSVKDRQRNRYRKQGAVFSKRAVVGTLATHADGQFREIALRCGVVRVRCIRAGRECC